MTETIGTVDPQTAYDGSYYTIAGAGGDLTQWTKGYEDYLDIAGIGTPTGWFTLTGAAVNAFARPARPEDAFKDDLTLLVFPLDGLNAGALALFKLRMGDRWFDDIVDNMRRGES